MPRSSNRVESDHVVNLITCRCHILWYSKQTLKNSLKIWHSMRDGWSTEIRRVGKGHLCCVGSLWLDLTYGDHTTTNGVLETVNQEIHIIHWHRHLGVFNRKGTLLGGLDVARHDDWKSVGSNSLVLWRSKRLVFILTCHDLGQTTYEETWTDGPSNRMGFGFGLMRLWWGGWWIDGVVERGARYVLTRSGPYLFKSCLAAWWDLQRWRNLKNKRSFSYTVSRIHGILSIHPHAKAMSLFNVVHTVRPCSMSK
jgi:hypothetical protein